MEKLGSQLLVGTSQFWYRIFFQQLPKDDRAAVEVLSHDSERNQHIGSGVTNRPQDVGAFHFDRQPRLIADLIYNEALSKMPRFSTCVWFLRGRGICRKKSQARMFESNLFQRHISDVD